MRSLSSLCLVTFLAGGWTAVRAQVGEPQSARVLRFEAPHLRIVPGGLEEQGFVMQVPVPGRVEVGTGSEPSVANNGGSYANVSGYYFMIAHRDGLPFTVTDFDWAENAGSIGSLITFQGKKENGSTVDGVFIVDRANDGVGPGADFQTFTFGESFARIVELRVTTGSHCLDNVHLTLHGTESPESPAPPPPLVYDIDWNGAPHTLNQNIVLGGPRAPSARYIGQPVVRSRIGGLKDRPVELKELSNGTDGFMLKAGLSAGRYVLEFDTTTAGASSLSVYLDHSQGRLTTELLANGALLHRALSDPGGPAGSHPQQEFSPQAVNHFRMDFHPAGGRVEVAMNGRVTATWTLPVGAPLDLRQVIFSALGDGVVGVDNLKLSAYERSNLVVTPSAYAFGIVAAGATATAPFTLRNTGDSPVTVTGAACMGADAAWRNVTFPFTIPPQGSTVVTLAVTPSAPTGYSGNGRFLTSDGGVQADWSVTGALVNKKVDFTRQPTSVIVATNLPASAISFTPAVTVATTGFQWLKNGVPIPGASNIQLSIPAATPASMVGDYRLRVTRENQVQVSRTARLGVVAATATTREAAVGSRVESTPVGFGEGLTFVWRHDGRLLTGAEPGVTLTGATLVLDPVAPEHQGVYVASAQMPDAHTGAVLSLPVTTLALTVPQSARITTTALHHWQVGRSLNFEMAATGSGTWTATGLPPGLEIQPNTGVIFGTPTTAATPQGVSVRYQPSITLLGGDPPRPATVLDLWVEPAAPATTQTYVGIVQPGKVAGDTRRLGGRLRFTVAATGSFTATMQVPLRNMTAKAAAGVLTYRPRDGVLAGVVRFTAPNYWQEYLVQIDSQGHLQTEDSLGAPAATFDAWRALAKLNPALHQAGLYPTALLASTLADLDSPSPLFGRNTPAGAGVLQVTLLASGRASYSGQLADGTSVTGSESVTAADLRDPTHLQLPLFLNAPVNRGSAVGWLTCKAGKLDGDLTWQKLAGATDVTYRSGFEKVVLTAIGDRHIATPATANHVARLGLPGSRQTLEIAAIEANPRLAATFSISTASRITRVPVTGKVVATLTLQPSTATFRGSADLATYRGMVVRGNYQGVFVPRLGMGIGFCIAPEHTYFSSYMNPRICFSRTIRLTPAPPP